MPELLPPSQLRSVPTSIPTPAFCSRKETERRHRSRVSFLPVMKSRMNNWRGPMPLVPVPSQGKTQGALCKI
jgi:hypothetical protein